MKLTEALSGSGVAGAERGEGGLWVIIHRSRSGYHLSRYSTNTMGRTQHRIWTFANLYELLIFARTQGFNEVDENAPDWQAVL